MARSSSMGHPGNSAGALSSESTSLGVGQAFLFGPRERVFFDQHTLSLVALAGAAKAHHDGAERRVPASSASQRGISTLKKHQVIEIGASETERPFRLHAKKASLPKLVTALGTGRVTHDPEHNNLVSARARPDPWVSSHTRSPKSLNGGQEQIRWPAESRRRSVECRQDPHGLPG